MIRSFRGGVHPHYHKAPEIPVKVIKAPPQVVIPMIQQIGAPAIPCVEVGDYVTMGQVVGTNHVPMFAAVHSSVSGKVIAVEPRQHPLGDMVMSVVIENDYKDTLCTDMKPLTEEELEDYDLVLDRLRDAGIVGMGGAMFPTAFKIVGGLGKVDKLVINGAECEPYLNGDHLTMLTYPEEVLKGIEILRKVSGLKTAYFGIEVNKQDAIQVLRSYYPEKYGVKIVREHVKYPQGAEKMQIKAVTGREVKPGSLPSGVGCNVISTRTAYAVYQACYEGRPCIDRIVTVSGSAMHRTTNALCRVGTPLGWLAEQCGGFAQTPRKIVLGGPMMGICATSLDAPTIKGTAGVLFFTEAEDRNVEHPTCIRCGKCVEVCPMNLQPVFMYMYYAKRDFDKMAEYHITDCFECGSCAYNCPGRMPLTHAFRTAKLMFQEKAAADKARAAAQKEAAK